VVFATVKKNSISSFFLQMACKATKGISALMPEPTTLQLVMTAVGIPRKVHKRERLQVTSGMPLLLILLLRGLGVGGVYVRIATYNGKRQCLFLYAVLCLLLMMQKSY
jgi:hypothetical protein